MGEEGEGMEETMYAWLARPEHAHRLHRFGCAMRAVGDATPGGAILSGESLSYL